MGKKFDIFYFSGTHWDREWYQDFQGFRYRLERMVNKLLDILDKDDNFKTFHFDGQTIVLEDYTEICLEGGNHAQFAYYGEQDGDGTAYITPENQQQKTVNVIRNMIEADK